jgi:hypothetical protein
MNCILKKCAHPGQAPCQQFGRCGAEHLVSQAKRDCGVTVHASNNRTLTAAMAAKLVVITSVSDRLAHVRAA